MTAVGEVFVRVRPDASGFKQEASGPIVAAGNALGKAFLAAFAIGGAAKTIESVVHAATEHQAAFAILDQTTRDAGASNTLFGQSLESLLEKEARLKGFTDEELASAFTRLVSATKNSSTAFKDLGLAEDVARARHISVEQAALAVSKAEQGVSTALQRLGIIVPKVTTNLDALKLAHDNAVAAGAKFTELQKQEYANAELVAKAQDKAATRVEALAIIQKRFGGDATVFAQTASGQFARLQADFHQFEVTVGTGLLSSLAGAAEGLGSFFTKASESERVRADIDHLTGDIRTGFNDIKSVAEAVAPVLLTVATAAKDVVSAIGGPAILTGVVAYKALKVAQTELLGIEGFYARAIAAARGETVADTSAQGRHTAAIAANTAALTGQADAATVADGTYTASLATTTAAIAAQTTALGGLAAAFATAGTAAADGAALSTLRLGTGVQTGTAVATGSEVAATDAAGASTVALAGETQSLTAALASLDAARAASIAASGEAATAADLEAAALARLAEADARAAAAAVSAGLATEASAAYFTQAGTAAVVAAGEETAAAGAAAAGGLAEFASGVGALGLAAVGGPVGAAVIGVAALAGGIAYLATRESETTRATHDFQSAIAGLAGEIQNADQAKLTLQADQLTLAQEKAALATSKLSHSSLEYRQMQNEIAQLELRVQQDRLNSTAAIGKEGDGYDKAAKQAENFATASLQAAQDHQRSITARGAIPDQSAIQTQAAEQFAAALFKASSASEALNPLLAHNQQLLADFADEFQKLPTSKQIELILDNKSLTANIKEALAGLPGAAATDAQKAGDSLGGIFGGAFAAAASTGVEAAAKAAQAIQVEADARAKFEAAAEPLRQGITSDKNDLAQLAIDMSDAVTQGAQQLAAAVQQAKVNLNTIGQDLANSLQQFIQKPLDDQAAKISAAQNRLTVAGDKITLQHLRGEVLLPGGKSLSHDPTKAIAQLERLEKTTKSPALQQFIQTYQAAALQEQSDQLATKQQVAQLIEKRASTRLANLTDLFNTGRISQATLERDVTALLRKQGLTEKTAHSRGAAFADTLAGQLTGLDQQATQIRTGPQQAGSGLIPSIVRPIDTLNATQKTLAGLASQERTKQLDESKKQTELLKKIHGAQAAGTFTSSLDHNSGSKTKKAVDLVGTGG